MRQAEISASGHIFWIRRLSVGFFVHMFAGNNARIVYNVRAGRTYKVKVWEYDHGTGGDYFIQVILHHPRPPVPASIPQHPTPPPRGSIGRNREK